MARRKLYSKTTAAMRAKKQRRNNRLSMLACGIVLIIVIIFFWQGRQSLIDKNEALELRKQELEAQLQQQHELQENLEDKKLYIETKKYIEDMAKSKFGLVYPDEIIFKPKNN